MDERSDTELLLASRADPVAFVELYRRHAEDLLRYFARRTLDPEAAAELTAGDVRRGVRVAAELPRHGGERRGMALRDRAGTS